MELDRASRRRAAAYVHLLDFVLDVPVGAHKHLIPDRSDGRGGLSVVVRLKAIITLAARLIAAAPFPGTAALVTLELFRLHGGRLLVLLLADHLMWLQLDAHFLVLLLMMLLLLLLLLIGRVHCRVAAGHYLDLAQ